MPSPAFHDWTTIGRARLDELEAIHIDATGSGPGRRWRTEQLNRSLFLVLVAQFQTFCRELHDAAIDVHIAHASPEQRAIFRTLLARDRKLATQTPRVSALGSDFGRLGFDVIADLKAEGPAIVEALTMLDMLIDFRNAIGHGNETELAALVATGQIKATKQSYRRYRRTLHTLAGTMDRVVVAGLSSVLQAPPSW